MQKATSNKLLYANCWEDADILLKALEPGGNDRILSIGSAGDNSFSLLSCSPEEVIVYDVSLPQLHLIELKKAAFLSFSHEDFLCFLGFEDSLSRKQHFKEKIKALLSDEAKAYWLDNMPLIENGVIHGGKLESYFSLYRKYILRFIASKKTIDRFFSGPQNQEDLTIYKKKLSNPFFRLLIKLFFSKPVLKAAGRNPKFFEEVKIDLSKYLFEKISNFILAPESYKNFYNEYISLGYFGDVLPHYARKENFDRIRANLPKLSLHNGNIRDGLEAEKDISLINASDIFEYMPVGEFKSFGEQIKRHCPTLKKIVYWNFVVDRILSEQWPDYFYYLEPLSTKLSKKDKLFFYKRFVVEASVKD